MQLPPFRIPKEHISTDVAHFLPIPFPSSPDSSDSIAYSRILLVLVPASNYR